jgi:hypothetical protein
MSSQFFTHRPPSAGVHLLNDPLPERTEVPAAMRADFENLKTKNRKRPRDKVKKPAF